MLTAMNNNGEILNLGKGPSISELKKLRESEEFYCPQCSGRLILKLGKKKIPHFAHEKWSLCSEYERESEYHLLGKMHLYNWLLNQHVDPQLELFLPEINQRPDIIFTYSNNRYCIEFQSSTISEDLFVKRTKQYLQNSIEPIWILAGKNIRRLSEYKVSLSHFDFLFLRKSSSLSFLYAYCPVTQKLIKLKNIYPISIRNAFAQFSISSLEHIKVDQFIFPKSNSQIHLKNWFKEIDKLKMNLLIKSSANQRKFLYELYQKNLYIQFLPSVIGLPLKESIWIETPPLIWQTYLFIDLFMKKKLGQTLSYQQVYLCFINRWKKRDIKIRSLPVAGEWHSSFVIQEYLHMLEKLGWLENINNNDYLIKRPFQISKNQEQQEVIETYCINRMLLQK